MSITTEVSKLAELRAKTDRQLFEIVSKALDHGLVSATVADAQYVRGDREQAERLQARAQRAYEDSGMFVPVIYGLSQHQRNRLEQRRRELREKLERVDEYREPLRRTACC
ncbi:MAG TPA: hypothetical protein VN442_05035 [Bryobacteraceae bacterium]|nr:hypothetical protein [Bryobacteraceae bacterium]HWR35830.1 hypothetical protein [Clostridia bacterium]